MAWTSPRCAGPGCSAARRAAVQDPASRHLYGLPAPTTRPGRLRDGRGPSRARGSQAPMSVAGTRPTVPLDELARCSRTALRSTALRSSPVSCARARSSPRPPATLGAGPPECEESARAGSTAAPVASLGGTSVASGAGPRERGRAARGSRRACCAVTPAALLGPLGVQSLPDEPAQPTAIPQTAPPSWVRGTCWGIFNAAGRVTGSPFLVLATA